MALFYAAAGVAHFRAFDFFMGIMPPYLPFQAFLVYASGVVEVALGILLVPRRTRPYAAWGVIGLLAAVTQVNVYMALYPEEFPQFGATGLYIRLVIQVGLFAWAYAYTGEVTLSGLLRKARQALG